MNPAIYIQDNFLSPNECSALIDFYELYESESFFYKTNLTKPFQLNSHTEEMESINDRVLNLICKLYQSNYYISNTEIVKWFPNQSKMNLHTDYQRDVWSVIVYLNDDYYGGNTFFETGMEVKPKIGTVVIFTGNQIRHGVKPIINGNRYTLTYWIRYE